jgi:antitoxin (DNA-binding transcriptional repressor) of toxin-antitoxin stability system
MFHSLDSMATRRRLRSLGLVLGATLLLGACGASLRPFPLAEVRWVDDDTRPFAPRPSSFYSSYTWDGADNTFFRPASEFFTFEAPSEAMNVNALDEVPDSSWFTNRLGRVPMTAEEVAEGACTDRDVPGPWTIVGGKPDGANPGFMIRDAAGRRYLLKTEGTGQPFRAGAADAIGAAVYHAAGFFTPCNLVVHFDRDILVRDPEATVEYTDGREEPLTEAIVERVLAAAARLEDGSYRAAVSRFIDGRPFGPWRYHGVRDGDLNDAIPHQHRRELRGSRLLAAWLDHIDSRQENTLASWMAEAGTDGAGHVRHYLVDWGDCLGILHGWDGLNRRFGHSGYLDLQHVLEDWLSLGLVTRPWERAAFGPAGQVLGYFDASVEDGGRFVAERWRPGYGNPAFERASERDLAWMARIIARFDDAAVDALTERARFPDPLWTAELARILKSRRDAILERYLTRLSPLVGPRVEGDEVCFEDLAVAIGLRDRATRRYAAVSTEGGETRALRVRRAGDAGVCVEVAVDGYAIVDVVAQSPGRETTGPARTHLRRAEGATAVVGLERPDPGTEVPR